MRFLRKLLATLIGLLVVGAAASVAAGSLKFKEVPVPILGEDGGDQEKRAVVASDTAWVNEEETPIGFKTLMRSGQGFHVSDKISAPQIPFGTLVDNQGRPIPAVGMTNSGATPSAHDQSPFLSNDNDFSSLIPHGEHLFLISHFEARPGAMYISGLKQDSDNGELTALWSRPIDFSSVRGGWVHCAGSVTPWSTHLGSEEYEPDARLVDQATGNKVKGNGESDDYYHAMADYFQGDRTEVNPYDYGYPVEVTVVSEEGDTEVSKHYAMGRMALELAYVMPDRKTAYLTDDGRMVGLFMFVADKEDDLSAGTLYAARWSQQKDGPPLGKADLRWINLGHATDGEIANYLTGPGALRFDDIFEATVPDNGGQCESGYTLVAKGHETTEGDTYVECLKLKAGMSAAASRLESRRYAAMLGATTELTKEEGITYDPDSNRLYIAMSDVTDGMLDNSEAEQYNGVLAGPNHIRVQENRCGAVYAADVDPKSQHKDTSGQPILSRYVAVNMYPEVAGTPKDYAETPYEGNTCDVDGIASPDNISYLPGYYTLIIGEDTSRHQNDMVWSYNTKSGELTRIQTTPYGSETTSIYWYPNVNGFGYLTSVVQHPFGESDEAQYRAGSSADRGYSGYIGPFPALQ